MPRPRFEIQKSTDGRFYWELVGSNNETLCVSETYESKQAAKKGIRAVMTSALFASTKDLTEKSSKASPVS